VAKSRPPCALPDSINPLALNRIDRTLSSDHTNSRDSAQFSLGIFCVAYQLQVGCCAMFRLIYPQNSGKDSIFIRQGKRLFRPGRMKTSSMIQTGQQVTQ